MRCCILRLSLRHCKTLIACSAFAALTLSPRQAAAQAKATATSNFGAQIGLGVTAAKPDYDSKNLAGATVYGNIDYKNHLGIDVEYHYLNLYSPLDFTENSFVAGPRYKFNFGRVHPYIKALGGRGNFRFEKGYYPTDSSQSYTLISAGGGVDYDLARHITVRGDFEYQDWVNFNPNGLTPALATIGIAYRFR